MSNPNGMLIETALKSEGVKRIFRDYPYIAGTYLFGSQVTGRKGLISTATEEGLRLYEEGGYPDKDRCHNGEP